MPTNLTILVVVLTLLCSTQSSIIFFFQFLTKQNIQNTRNRATHAVTTAVAAGPPGCDSRRRARRDAQTINQSTNRTQGTNRALLADDTGLSPGAGDL